MDNQWNYMITMHSEELGTYLLQMACLVKTYKLLRIRYFSIPFAYTNCSESDIINLWRKRNSPFKPKEIQTRKKQATMTTKVTSDQVLELARQAGCDVDSERLKTYHAITCGDAKKAIYVAKSKKVLTRVDFSGFELEASNVIKCLSAEEAKGMHLGAVRAQILTKNLDASDEELLEAFKTGIEELKSDSEGFKLARKVKPSNEETEAQAEEPVSIEILQAADEAPVVQGKMKRRSRRQSVSVNTLEEYDVEDNIPVLGGEE